MMKKVFRPAALLALCIAAFFSGGAEAGEDGTTSWEKCIRIAEMNNPDIVSARELIIQQEAASNITRSSMLPQISASAAGTKTYAEKTDSKSFSYGIEAKQLIFDGFKTYYDLKSARAKETAAYYNYQVTSATVRKTLRTAYVNLLKAQKLVPIAKEIETRRKHIMDVVKLHYDSGTEHRGSYFSAKADYMSAQSDTVSAERNLETARRTLATLMGLSEKEKISAEGDLFISGKYDQTPDVSMLAANSPSAKKAALTKEAASYDASSSRLDYLPKVYGTAGADRSGDTFLPKETTYSLGVSASLSLFEGGQSYYTVKKYDSASKQAEADEKSARDTAFRTIEAAWDALRDSIENVEVQNQYLSAAEERSKIGEVQYLTGTLTFNNWTIIENALVSAKKSYLEASAEVLRTEAAWIQSIGGTIENESKK